MERQPTATAFVKKQISFADFLLRKIRAAIEEREEALYELGIPTSDFDTVDPELYTLYEDELFWERFAGVMEDQRVFLRERYLR